MAINYTVHAGAFPIFCNRSWGGHDDTTLTGFRTLSGLTLRQRFIKTWQKLQKIRNAPVHAEVVDIRNDTPGQDDIFLVDTNVWYWVTYSRADLADTRPKPYQTNDYPSYISKAISAKSQLHRCGLSLAELAHLIERTEREIYSRSNGALGSKEYRHNHSTERANVVAEIQTAWSQVNTMAQTLGLQIDEQVTNAAFSRLSSQPLDGYDLFILEAISKAGVVKVITDDGDFVTVPGIQIFTANHPVIKTAQSQGKLMKR